MRKNKELIKNIIYVFLLILVICAIFYIALLNEQTGYYAQTGATQPDGTHYIWVEEEGK